MKAAPPFYIREDDPPAKRQILRAAMKLFSERGFAATSIRDIASESGYTNPALYKHFAGKEELAVHLFETCHRRMWARCNAAVASARSFDDKLDGYIGQWLELVDEHPEVVAFLSDSARVLWPKASPVSHGDVPAPRPPGAESRRGGRQPAGNARGIGAHGPSRRGDRAGRAMEG